MLTEQDVGVFEHRTHPLLPRQASYQCMARSWMTGLSLLAVELGIRMLGYHFLEQFT